MSKQNRSWVGLSDEQKVLEIWREACKIAIPPSLDQVMRAACFGENLDLDARPRETQKRWRVK